MVLKDDDYKVDGNMNESQSLKFGMDRILSEDVSSSAKKHPGRCSNGFQPPCAGCLSSLYRCCQLSNLSDSSHFNRGPEPFKTYTNALITATSEVNLNRGNEPNSNSSGDIVKRKRSWSRAVFSNLQRKGLEKRFQIQKYITKPDRRQLAATLGLTDAQVKVWFQNRRMKWRHSKELSRQNVAHHNESSQNVLEGADSSNTQITKSDCESDVDVQNIDN